MLGKILKYDLKSNAIIYFAMYAVSILLTGGALLFSKLQDNYPGNVVFNVMLHITVIGTIISMFALFVVTLILGVIRYYNNLLKDEGYLMHTLPVSPVVLHFSKMLTMLIWYILDAVVVVINITIISEGKLFEVLDSGLQIMIVELGIQSKWIVVVCVIGYFLLAAIQSMSMFYASMNLGSLSNTNKGLMSVVAYICCYMASQVISSIVMVVYGIGMAASDPNADIFMEEAGNDVVFSIFGIAAVISVVFAVAYNIISVVIMSKKLNLE